MRSSLPRDALFQSLHSRPERMSSRCRMVIARLRASMLGVILELGDQLGDGIVERKQPLLDGDSGERGREALARRAQVVQRFGSIAVEVAFRHESSVTHDHQRVDSGEMQLRVASSVASTAEEPMPSAAGEGNRPTIAGRSTGATVAISGSSWLASGCGWLPRELLGPRRRRKPGMCPPRLQQDEGGCRVRV